MKYLVAALTGIGLYLLYLQSEKVYVDNVNSTCSQEQPFLERERNLITRFPYACDVSFRLSNMTSEDINASYTVRSVEINPGTRHKWGSVKQNFEKSGSKELSSKESAVIHVAVGSLSKRGSVKVKSWVNE